MSLWTSEDEWDVPDGVWWLIGVGTALAGVLGYLLGRAGWRLL